MATEFKLSLTAKEIDEKLTKQPDYLQNDSTAVDYIKNRPFYKETVTLFDEDVTTVLDADGQIDYIHSTVIIDFTTVNVGDKFEVLFDGTPYVCEIKDLVMPFIGNIYLVFEQLALAHGITMEDFLAMMEQIDPGMAALAVDTGEPFTIMDDGSGITVFITREAGTFHFTINSVDIKKFDSSFINWVDGSAPNGLPEVTTDDNDKVLVVIDGKWTVSSIANGDEVAY